MKHRYLVVVGMFGILLTPLVSDACCERTTFIKKTCTCEQTVYVRSCQALGQRICVDFCQTASCCGGSQTFEQACDEGPCPGPATAVISERPRLGLVKDYTSEVTTVRTISPYRAMLSN